MTLEAFRARFFNPDKWVVTGLTWSALTLAIMTLIDAVPDGQLRDHEWPMRLAIFAVAGLAFGLLFRFVARREHDDAR